MIFTFCVNDLDWRNTVNIYCFIINRTFQMITGLETGHKMVSSGGRGSDDIFQIAKKFHDPTKSYEKFSWPH